MNDWNQDGRIDDRDKTAFHNNVLENKDLKSGEHAHTNGDEEGILGDLIINGICALILFFIFGADVQMNSFVAIVSLICLVKIGWSLFVLFINATSK